MSEPNAIVVDSLTKRYGDKTVVDNLQLEVAHGEVFALLGPNGAGKTTTVEILEGFRRPTTGSVRVLGVDPPKGNASWRSDIGIVLQSSGALDELNVGECVQMFAATFPSALDADEALRLVDLSDRPKQRIDTLSGGQRRRLEIACGIVGQPKLLFLDEPTTGLDPQARRHVWSLIEGLRNRGVTILLTTHYLEEAETLADRVGVINHGKLVASGTPAEVSHAVDLKPEVAFSRTSQLVGELPQVEGEVREDGDNIVIQTVAPTAVVTALADWSHSLGVDELPNLTVRYPTLEDTYLQLVSDDDEAIEAVK